MFAQAGHMCAWDSIWYIKYIYEIEKLTYGYKYEKQYDIYNVIQWDTNNQVWSLVGYSYILPGEAPNVQYNLLARWLRYDTWLPYQTQAGSQPPVCISPASEYDETAWLPWRLMPPSHILWLSATGNYKCIRWDLMYFLKASDFHRPSRRIWESEYPNSA